MKRCIHITLVLVLAAHGWAAGAVTYVCQMSGDVMDSCCCPERAAQTCDAFEAADLCCDVSVTHPVASPSASRPATSGPEQNSHPAWTASASLAMAMLTRMPEGYATALASDATASPPPLILITQSFRC